MDSADQEEATAACLRATERRLQRAARRLEYACSLLERSERNFLVAREHVRRAPPPMVTAQQFKIW